MNAKQQLLHDLETVKARIVQEVEDFVCVAAIYLPSEEHITNMVKMHIGDSYTMTDFLCDTWECQSFDLTRTVLRSYRICMLNNMIRMVESGEYRG